MPDLLLPLAQLFDLTVAVFFAPGDYLVDTGATIASGFFPVHPGIAPFTDGGPLAASVSAVFWVACVVELWILLRYIRTLYNEYISAWYLLKHRIERHLQRHRIMRVCRQTEGAPDSRAESTIVEELEELEDLAVVALRIVRDKSPDSIEIIKQIQHSSKVSGREIRRALQHLELLDFISPERSRKRGSVSYHLTLTGKVYLQVCKL